MPRYVHAHAAPAHCRLAEFVCSAACAWISAIAKCLRKRTSVQTHRSRACTKLLHLADHPGQRSACYRASVQPLVPNTSSTAVSWSHGGDQALPHRPDRHATRRAQRHPGGRAPRRDRSCGGVECNLSLPAPPGAVLLHDCSRVAAVWARRADCSTAAAPHRYQTVFCSVRASWQTRLACGDMRSDVVTRAGVHSVSLAECGYGAIPWPELKQLQHMQRLALP